MSQLFAIPAFFDSAHVSDFGTLNSTPSGSIIVLDESIFTNPPFNPNVPPVIQNYHNANLKVLGYVPTFNAKVPQTVKQSSGKDVTYNTLSDLQNAITTGFTDTTGPAPVFYPGWIDSWYSNYSQIDGIFFDIGPEADVNPITTTVQKFYHSIYTYVGTKSGQHIVLLNASQYEDPAGDWIMAGPNQACDIAILWETRACEYFFMWPPSPPVWWVNPTYAPDRIAHTIYDCHNTDDMRQVIAVSNQRGPTPTGTSGGTEAKYMYVTDSDTATYGHLPQYWSDELAALMATPTVLPMALPLSYQFYVRDWTDSPAIYDTGQVTPPNRSFVTTSDVWNSLTPSRSFFDPTTDQPINDDPQLDAAGNNTNYAFARIHRNPCFTDTSETVSAYFLWADFNMAGSNFQYVNATKDASKSQATFPTMVPPYPDPKPKKFFEQTTTPGVKWMLPASVSAHICLAVEISTDNPQNPTLPKDSFTTELNGQATGSASDSLVRNDKHQAQRNLTVTRLPASPRPSPFSRYAIAHNADLFSRDMLLTYEMLEAVQEILRDVFVEVIDAQGMRMSKPFKSGDGITLEDMQPGENRWVGLTAQVQGGNDGQVLPVTFYELVENRVVNGCAIAIQPSPLSTVMLANLNLHALEFRRIAVTFEIDDAKDESKDALELFVKSKISSNKYMHFLRSHAHVMSRVIYELGWSQEAGDPFGIRNTLKSLIAAVESGNLDLAIPTHTQMLEKLDGFTAMLQKAQGDTADILQMVRWQRELYSILPLLKAVKGAHRLIEESQAFITAYQAGRIGNDSYPTLIRNLLHIFHQTAEALEEAWIEEGVEEALEQDITTMEQHMGTLAGLQKAHRAYLLKLQRLSRKE